MLLRVTLALLMLLPAVVHAQLLNPGPLHKTHSDMNNDDSCSDCHSSGKRVGKELCLNCHKDLGTRIAQKKGLHGLQYRSKTCETCHIEHIGKNSRLIRWPGGQKEAFQHKLSGWSLEGKHAKTKCAKCHDQRNRRGNPTYLGARPACAGCHDDPHEKRLGKDCKSCHSASSWEKGAIDQFDHKLARFPLTGAHDDVKCKDCHGEPPRWQGISFGKCSSCHEDPHSGRFNKRTCESCHVDSSWKEVGRFRSKHPGISLKNGHRRVGCKSCHDRGNSRKPSKGRACVKCHDAVHLAKFGNNCKACHGSIKWTRLPESIGRASHGKTRFSLKGLHKKTPCAKCHQSSIPQKKRYRNLAHKRCTDCHADEHEGSFQARDKGECSGCHTPRGFWPANFDTPKHKTTNFPLEGRHKSTPCSRCHESSRPKKVFRVEKKACVDCHENPHGDQFKVEMSKGGCSTCHNASGWSRPNIDHKAWPLTNVHATTPCEACHKASESDRALGSGATYKGVSRNCEGCHEDVHVGQFRLTSPKRACKECHTTKGFKITKFEHAATTGHSLTQSHATLDCSSCHPKESLPNGGEAIRYRLGYSSCSDCHANPHSRGKREALQGLDCSACHTGQSWPMSNTAGQRGGFDHARTGFPLSGEHGAVLCTNCHKPKQKVSRECASCHQDQHRGRLGLQCDSCHNPRSWQQTRASRRHRLTRLPLTGMHAVLDCSSCHLRRNDRQYQPVPADCFACHEDDYRRDIHPSHLADAATGKAAFSRQCSNCHQASGWSPAYISSAGSLLSKVTRRADHDKHFLLSRGSHRSATCQSCHTTPARPKSFTCLGCHAHSPVQLQKQHAGPVPTSPLSCLGCHPRGRSR